MGDLPLQFHDFKHLDHTKRCPKYTAALSKLASTSLQPSELDDIYTDLESLLGAANIRQRQLESEIKILGEWADKKDRKGLIELDFLSQIGNKRTAKPVVEERPSKKSKCEESKSTISKAKGKGSGKCPKSEPDPEVYISKPKAATDAPNKFWSTVEPYCADITIDDLKILEDIIKAPTEDGEYFRVPPLGKHYTQVWAQEDLNEEQREGNKTEKRRAGASLSSNSENMDFEKKSKNLDLRSLPIEEETCPFGPLTQRLLSALVDENILAPMDENYLSDNLKQIGGTDNSQNNPASQNRSFTIPHAKALETAIKDELINLGLIESQSDEEGDMDIDDEVNIIYYSMLLLVYCLFLLTSWRDLPK